MSFKFTSLQLNMWSILLVVYLSGQRLTLILTYYQIQNIVDLSICKKETSVTFELQICPI